MSAKQQGEETAEGANWRNEGEDYARRLLPEFAKDHPDALARLVGEYSDLKAEETLQDLREAFWSGEWERKKYGRGTVGQALTVQGKTP